MGDNTPMDLRHLREATRPEHEATETAMPLMDSQLTLETYKAVLGALLPLLRGWERWAAAQAPEALRPLLAARQRSALLEHDLRALGGVGIAEISEAASVDWTRVVLGPEDLRSVLSSSAFTAGFLGAFYVIEGSTLGGRLIARHLEPVLHLAPGEGDAYFRGHGDATGLLWREVTDAITAVPAQDAALVIEAAKRTFTAYRGHLLPLRARRNALERTTAPRA